jgi:4,5-dihydroxyphthalate decarboxylase
MTVQQTTNVRIALGDYPHTMALKKKEITSPNVALDFADVKPTNRAFAPMVRQQAFDVSEMAIVTYLQARAYGKPIILMPAVMLGRFQHECMLYNTERGQLKPADLPGKRIGVRAYSQTTAVWLRGILHNDYGVDTQKVRWVTFEDAHVPEYRDPPGVERAAAGKDILKMLLEGELDAAIFGAELPSDPRLKSVISNPEADVKDWYAKHKVVPVNHLVCVTEALSKSKPAVVAEVFRMLQQSKVAAGAVKPGGIDLHPFGLEALRPALTMIIDYSVQQQLIPRRFEVDELFDDTTRRLGS